MRHPVTAAAAPSLARSGSVHYAYIALAAIKVVALFATSIALLAS
jgi:hypothetical protein